MTEKQQNSTDADSDIQNALRHLDHDTAAVDTTALQQIRKRVQAETVAPQRSRSVDSQTGESRQKFSGAVATLASSLALLLLTMFLTQSEAQDAPSLGELLQDLKSANNVRMEVKRADESVRIELQAPGTVRWTDNEHQYRIADGHRLWKIDSRDKANPKVAVEQSPIPADGTDALQLIGLDMLNAGPLNRVQPSGSGKVDGILCQTYESPIKLNGTAATLQAFASEATGKLVSLRVSSPQSSGGRHLLAEVRLHDADPDTDTFQVHRSLKDDGRVGSLTDVHGLVFVRSFPGHRWTPATPSMALFAGDQLRCESRGANAAVATLSNGTQLTLGPAAQLTLRPDTVVELQHGDLRVRPLKGRIAEAASESRRLEVVVGPDGSVCDVAADTILRATAAPPQVQKLNVEPPWLKTLNDKLSTETMGSLVAQVDGRDHSLSIGFHHVSVEIRDQIARTVIEESFVNNTKERLEGVFHFPLPHDASISGFGMWIGDQLVEADVVEKQRAREIYEQILREKRDPGLLEWAGGNIFKARVFPIEPFSEKKIRITYTQTLPLQNGTFRYNYALRSELLQQTPLRDLSIDVTLHSATPISLVRSPSHPAAAIQTTGHSARVDYSARNVTPDRDFELLCSLDGHQQDVIAIPHVRGEDGYMMIQLSPPAVGAGNWSRTLVRDSRPLNVILLCDTSGSMDQVARQQQSKLVSAILGSLSESDTVRMACCDVKCEWLQQTPVGVTTDLRNRLVKLLEQRASLGWSDLQTTLRNIVNAADGNTHVIYIGDGTVVNERSEAASGCIAWLNGTALLAEHEIPGRKTGNLPTMHGIAVGNAFDMNVIRAVGRVGRGTSRSVAGSESPVAVARQLLFEITRPGLKNLKVEFRNVQVAAVYPRELPNLADGMQHILTGRFRPSENNADAEIIVTGQRGDEEVTYAARMPLNVTNHNSDQVNQSSAGSDIDPSSVDRNSFIPRLWAKAHLDHLLMESATEEIQKRIVAISKQYHLMTPYTSLLVLETDADRQRFGVEKSTQMRDGEEFFAEGRKEAEYSLRQQQLAQAKLYRQQLYASYRQQIQNLASTPFPVTQQQTQGRSNQVRLGRRYMHRFGDFELQGIDRFTGLNSALNGVKLVDTEPNYGAVSLQPFLEEFNTSYDTDVKWYSGVTRSYYKRSNEPGLIAGSVIVAADGAAHEFETIALQHISPVEHLSIIGENLRFENSWEDLEFSGRGTNAAYNDFFFNDNSAYGRLSEVTRGQRHHWGLQTQFASSLSFSVAAEGRGVRGTTDAVDYLFDPTPNRLPGLQTGRGFAPMVGTQFETGEGEYLRRAQVKLFEQIPSFGETHNFDFDIDGNNAFDVAGIPETAGMLFSDFGIVGGKPFASSIPSVAVEPPTFGFSDVLPERDTSTSDIAPWPEVIKPFFPAVVHAGAAPEDSNDPAEPNYPESDWPAEVTTVLRSLDQSFSRLNGGLSLASQDTQYHPVSGRATGSVSRQTAWAAERGWLHESTSDQGPLVRWSLQGKSGAWLPAFRTGRTATHPGLPGRSACIIPLPGLSAMMIEWTSTRNWSAKLISRDADRAVVLLTHRANPWLQKRFTFDLKHRCVLQAESIADGVVRQSVQYSDHVEIETLWLPQTITASAFEPVLGTVARTAQRKLSWKSLTAVALKNRIEEEVALAQTGILIDGALPGREETAAAIANGKPEFEHRLVNAFKLIHQGRWKEALPALDDALDSHGHRQNGRWLRWSLMTKSAQKEQLRNELPSLLPDTLQRWDLWPIAENTGKARTSDCRIAVIDKLKWLSEQVLSVNDQLGALRTFDTLLSSLDADRNQQAGYLNSLISLQEREGRAADAIAVRTAYAKRWPDWLTAQIQHLSAIIGNSAPAVINRTFDSLLADNRKWTAAEWNQLYRKRVDWQREQGEFAEGLNTCQKWTRRCPFEADAWEHTLRSHLELDRPDAVRKLRDQWLATVLKDAPVDAAIPQKVQARFKAAFNFGFGQMAGLSLAGPQQEVRNQLLQIAEKFSKSDRNFMIADRVLQDRSFARESDGKALMKRLLLQTQNEINEISNYRLQKLFSWLEVSGVSGCDEHNALLTAMRRSLDDDVSQLTRERLSLLLFRWGVAFDEGTPKEQSQRWLNKVVRRWQDYESQDARDAWAGFILNYETKVFDQDHQLAWLRRYHAECRDVRRQSAAYDLFSGLLKQPWSDEVERETWQLISQIVPAETPELRKDHTLSDDEVSNFRELHRLAVLLQRTSLVKTWTDGVLHSRVAALQKDDSSWDERTRQQQSVLNKRFRIRAVRAMVKTLDHHISSAEKEEKSSASPLLTRLSSWLTIQRLTLERELSRGEVIAGVTDAEKQKRKLSILGELQRLLPDVPVKTPDPDDKRTHLERLSDRIRLNARHWLFAQWLQLCYEIDEDSETHYTDNVLAYVRAGGASDHVAPRAWRAAEFGILVSLNRPDELEKRLRQWVREDVPTAPWRTHLGQLLAELDRLDEAVRLYEVAGRQHLLSAAEWKLLSVWQHALDRRDDMEESLRQEWLHTSLSQKQARLQNELSEWKNNTTGRSPTAPADVVRRLTELMETSAGNKNSLITVKRWYLATHDPLVLRALGSFMTGLSRPGMLEASQYTQSLINEIDQEAGIDMLYQSLAETSKRISDDELLNDQQRNVDRLGLKLFEMQAAAHASRIRNQPGPHAERAVAAIRSLSAHEWQHDELSPVAERLSHLGKLNNAQLQKVRFETAMDLLAKAKEGSAERLGVALRCASIAERDSHQDRPIEILDAEFRTYLSQTSAWCSEAGQVLDRLVRHLHRQKRFVAAERLLVDILQELDIDHIHERLWKVRIAALANNGRTTLGEGSQLYQQLRDSVWRNVVQPDRSSQFAPAWTRLQQVFEAGQKAKLDEVSKDVQVLAGFVDRLIRRHSDRHTEIIERLFWFLKSGSGPRNAVEFILTRLDAQPVALQWTQPRSIWNNFADNLYEATWPKPKEENAARQLAPEVRPLRRQVEAAMFEGFEIGLNSRDNAQHYYFDHRRIAVYRNGRQRALDTAARVAQAAGASESQLVFVAKYLKNELEEPAMAAEHLQAAFDRNLLSYANQVWLADLYFETKEFKQGVTVLQKITGIYNRNLDLRFKLMDGYFQLADHAALQTELKYILNELVNPRSGHLSNLFKVADRCRMCELWNESAELYDVAFERREWPTGPDTGLSSAWLNYAECLINLERTNDALDAVSAAWVICGSSNEYRDKSRAQLDRVLAQTGDLGAAAEYVSRRAQESGEESSFLRRALGKAFLDSGQPGQAEKHLRIALELQSGDRETRTNLIAAFDRQGKADDAIDTLIEQLESEPRNYGIHKDLYARFKSLQQPRQAERAATSIVETAVEEPAHHFALAELREQQNAAAAAIVHWQRAADLGTNEPWALVRLAKAYLKTGDRLSARRTLAKLETTEWDERFDGLPRKLRALRRELRSF